MYANMDMYGLPEHLIDHVAKHLHANLLKDVKKEVIERHTDFEKIFLENSDDDIELLDKIKMVYPDSEIWVDNYVDWITIVFKLTKSKFVLFHQHKEYRINKEFYMEGEVDNKKVYVSRFFYGDMWGRVQHTCDRIEKYLSGGSIYGLTLIPFGFLQEVMGRESFSCSVEKMRKTFVDHESAQTSMIAKSIIRWFIMNENDLVDMHNSMIQEFNEDAELDAFYGEEEDDTHDD